MSLGKEDKIGINDKKEGGKRPPFFFVDSLRKKRLVCNLGFLF